MREAGHGGHARAPHRRGLGRELVRLDEDARRPRVEPAPEARRRLRGRRATSTPSAASGFRFAGPDELGTIGAMSLRARLLAAFAYVLVLVIVALEVPLALNLSRRRRRRDQERGAGPGADPGAPTVSGRLGDGASSAASLASAAGRDLGGRVIVVDRAGGCSPTRPAPASGTRRTRAAPRSRRRCAAAPRRAPATATRSTRTCCTPPCRSLARAAPWARCG